MLGRRGDIRDRFKHLSFDVGEPPPSERSRERPRGVGDTSPLEDVVVRFGKELESLGGAFIQCEERRVSDVVAAQLRKLGVHTVMTWCDDELVSPAILQRLRDEGFLLKHPEFPHGIGSFRQSYLTEIETVDAGLTGSVAGIAETGTLVLPSGPNRSQVASLLPAIHIALLPVEALYFSVGDWLSAEGRQWIDHSSCVTLISGPSRTADIEMTMTIGVHGPGTLIVVCYD
jgi:L-lactate dehydrogenase complex protein LldG